ncbi:hypothetical protein C3408_26115 [Candidatus Pantoea alvi]|uniref:hypothetical protein n=1 Tax=Enterobacter agglomerans TaxID=549 RepID=UPI000CDD0C1F|nr:hypothetical protein [Pantoea agglomerans]POW45404.1 hypothetical protein C3408_26115 [Pantoea alvi]UBN54227.1 hypothetical protein LB453_20785 [Pantoea agglomerans]
MRTIAACHKVFTENNGLEVNISVIIKRRKMINPRTLSQAAAHKSGAQTARHFTRPRCKDLGLHVALTVGRDKKRAAGKLFLFIVALSGQKSSALAAIAAALTSENQRQRRAQFAGFV